MDIIVSISFFRIRDLWARTVKPPFNGRLVSDDRLIVRRNGIGS